MSKRIWNHPVEAPTARKYWRSVSELEDTPDFRQWLEREFPQGAAMMKDESDAGQSRRDFIKLMGAATSLAGFGLAACRRPETKIKPYAHNVEWIIPGKALYYASSMPRLGGSMPVVVTTFEGRPTHIQGNALHPESNGSVDSFTQASVLDLYDPERSREFRQNGKVRTRERFLRFFGKQKRLLSQEGGKGLALLLDDIDSPTRARMVKKVIAKFPAARVFRYEAITLDNVNAAAEAAFGKGVVQVPHFSVCEKILALDCDFLGLERPKAGTVSRFMSGRRAEKPGDPMNRLYVLESHYTVTGGTADHRLRVHTSQMMKAAVALARELGTVLGDASLAPMAASVKPAGNYQPRADFDAWIREAAKDLAGSRGKAMVLVGAQQPVEVHLIATAINQALGAFAPAAEKGKPPLELLQREPQDYGTLAELAQAARNKEINTLAIIGAADPAYDAPTDVNWPAAQSLIGSVIHVGFRHRSATARAAQWHVPGTHFLEEWGDVRSMSGVYSVIQPMILPLFGGVSDIEFLHWLSTPEPLLPKVETPALVAPANGALPEDSKDPAYLAVRETFAALAGTSADIDAAWGNVLRDGFLAQSQWPAFGGSINSAAIVEAVGKFSDVEPPTLEKFEVTLVPDSKVWDGRYINNGWLQECPDPISKITWDNAALVSVRTATDLGLNKYLRDRAQIIEVTFPDTKEPLRVPVIVAPGHADNAITISLGYGQSGSGENGPGRVGEGTGVNVYPLRTSARPYCLTGAAIKVTADNMPLAVTQEHSTTYGRELVREGTRERYQQDPGFASKEGMDAEIAQDFSLYKQVGKEPRTGRYDAPHLSDLQHQWGMVIDLQTCVGCNACTLACQSENNIPIVGKRQVMVGREMHWLRLDRYFAVDLDGKHNKHNTEWEYTPTTAKTAPDESIAGDHGETERLRQIDDPEMLMQPMACQHCEAAPCETVCPVNATVHSEDGLNLMVYNRCIGTRYCANNCPYKVRRFNFFDYNKRENIERDSFLGLHPNNLYLGPAGKKKDDRSERLQKNPNVTVRMRGVIEKCTYCIQRIEAAKFDQKRVARAKLMATGRLGEVLGEQELDEALKLSHEDLRVPTDRIKTACQQACPADAIVFGNLRDNKSRVSQLRGNKDIVGEGGVDGHPRNYTLLRYLGVRPRTSYLARIKNPNPALLAASTIEMRKVGQASAHVH
ncbi:MAG: TAT-variant-translocated molybdopterin oxidoreductase [Verrucomicrobiales bacterium]